MSGTIRLIHWIKSFIGILFFILILFFSAGRLNYVEGWIYSALSFLGLILSIALTNEDSELLQERSKPPRDAKEWDKNILKWSTIITILAYGIAGLDSGRYQWSPHFHWVITLLGILCTVTGQSIFLAAKKTNRYFSSVVRIQIDRGHSVCDTGLYRIVRHPGYMGMIISWIGFPMILGSLWSILPIMAAIVLLILRTNLEDGTLMNELAGYIEYSQKTKNKLIPGIW